MGGAQGEAIGTVLDKFGGLSFFSFKQETVAFNVIISTHSAELLNAFDIDRVLVFEKDEENLTSVS